ncbi:hypothetical protein P5673_005102 [Acropora cervicornis]|uniref:Uncharacterized protein n=1 Tax=Acropora cervicornis TaxID=6130 RepID=A0AAD9QZQ0_ACRCE|nr:hypothetical protein P5673_005102 [Acropora cervicornis]
MDMSSAPVRETLEATGVQEASQVSGGFSRGSKITVRSIFPGQVQVKDANKQKIKKKKEKRSKKEKKHKRKQSEYEEASEEEGKIKQEEKENVKMIKRERKMILKAINQTNTKRILNGERITLHQAMTHPMEKTIIVVPKVVTVIIIIIIIIHLIKILQGNP